MTPWAPQGSSVDGAEGVFAEVAPTAPRASLSTAPPLPVRRLSTACALSLPVHCLCAVTGAAAACAPPLSASSSAPPPLPVRSGAAAA